MNDVKKFVTMWANGELELTTKKELKSQLKTFVEQYEAKCLEFTEISIEVEKFLTEKNALFGETIRLLQKAEADRDQAKLELEEARRVMRDNFNAAVKATCEPLELLLTEAKQALEAAKQRLVIGADGTTLKCTCSRPDCHELHLSSGDRVLVVSYFDVAQFDAAIAKLESLKGEEK